jgi:hypothetical protein
MQNTLMEQQLGSLTLGEAQWVHNLSVNSLLAGHDIPALTSRWTRPLNTRWNGAHTFVFKTSSISLAKSFCINNATNLPHVVGVKRFTGTAGLGKALNHTSTS